MPRTRLRRSARTAGAATTVCAATSSAGRWAAPSFREKLFYFGGYQGTRVNVTPTDFFQFVPTPAMLAGDFTAITSPACNAGRTIALRAPFVGTRVAPSLFSPAARNLQGRLPAPDQRLRPGLLRSEDREYRAPGDRSSRLPVEQQPLDLRPLPACAVPVGARQRSEQRAGLRERPDRRHHSLARDRRHVAARIEYRQFVPRDLQQRRYSSRTTCPSSITGRSGSGTSPFLCPTSDRIACRVVFRWGRRVPGPAGTRRQHSRSAMTSASSADSTSSEWGSTSSVRRLDGDSIGAGAGNFVFNGSFAGLGLADFLLGRPSAFNQAQPFTPAGHTNYVGSYVQDAWTVTSKLTLNIGLRWDPFFPVQERPRAFQSLQPRMVPQRAFAAHGSRMLRSACCTTVILASRTNRICRTSHRVWPRRRICWATDV